MASPSKAEKQIRAVSESDFNKFFDEFSGESDRAAVILGAAKLDLLLYQIIQQFLLPTTSNKDELLDGDSPLGTFSAKIMLANRLGLIDNEFTRALQFVRRIRNSFAHEVTGCALENGAHRDRVKELVAQMRHKNAFIEARKLFREGEDEPSTNFRTALAFLVGRLEYLLNHIETVDHSQAISIFSAKHLAMGEVENHRKKAIATPSVQPTQTKSAKRGE